MISFYVSLLQPGDLEYERERLFAEYTQIIGAGLVSSNDLFLECLWEQSAMDIPGLLCALRSSVCVLTSWRYLANLALAKEGLRVFALQDIENGCVICRHGTVLPPWVRTAIKNEILE